MEIDDDEMSDTPVSAVRSIKTGSENRDSPNSSMTSISVSSASQDVKPTLTAKTSSKDENSTTSTSYLYTKVSALCRPKSSIPTRLQPAEYARQCVAAAESSRLSPYALHEDEHKLLQDKLCQLHVTVYLNIRNGILRLWSHNPSVSVTLDEAIGCVKDQRWTRLACFAWEWLVRRGYINFGCVEAPLSVRSTKGRKSQKGETIVVIGGGMAGLSTARQLTNLFQHFPDHTPPRIIVLEGRNRIGGRIYSHPLSSMRSATLPPDQRPTAEMGAHIIVGFERGNPLDAIIRGQLALDYHLLRDLSTLYDINGIPVEGGSDAMIERLYNDVLDRTGHYRLKTTIKKTAQGDKELMDAARDPPEDDSLTIKQYEEATAQGTIDQYLSKKSRRRGAGHRAGKTDKSKEEVETNTDSKVQLPAAEAAKEFGFRLSPNTQLHETLHLDDLAKEFNQSLGKVMLTGIDQYQRLLDLKPYALRLINWHFANLEYANAANVDKLSLRAWDQDIGHEFEGEHAQVVGGYQQVPRALWRCPEPLDVRTNKSVKSIRHGAGIGGQGKATVVCEDGESFEADKVVFSAPLGVLKSDMVHFDPPLPQWKRDAIRRMGFGLLNKLVLVFERPFWDIERDMFGLLRAPRSGNGAQQDDYKEGRGQFYLFWNCIDTCGLPVLIALMAGDSAFEAEKTPDQELVTQCLSQLRNVFGSANVPPPLETIVTRWGSDRFARGTYSFVAKEARPQDYDMIAEPISNLFFAGEATCGTHPATVHGAYLSGLRAAHEVFESMVGPIAIPPTLVPPSSGKQPPAPTIDLTLMETHMVQPGKRKGDPVIPAGTFTRPVKEKDNHLHDAWDAAMWVRIYNEIGPPPVKPPKSNVNAFLMYQMQHWERIKGEVQAKRAAAPRRGKQQSERDEVRTELGKMWAALSEEAKTPYTEEARTNREENDKLFKEWQVKAAQWDKRTWEVKAAWIEEGNSFEEFCKRKREEDAVMDADANAKRVKV